MALTSLSSYIAAAKQQITWCKTAALTTVAAVPFTPFAIAGNPGAGTLAIGNTANGLVPTDATAGCPLVDAFGVGNTGYLTRVRFASSVACRIILFDRLFTCGAYAFNANTNLASQPDYSGRLPGGSYNGLEIWAEQVTAATGIQGVTVTYDDDTNTSRVTPTTSSVAAGIVGRCWQIPLVAGGSTVKKITNVTGSTATVGTFNVSVMRRLWEGRVKMANDGDTHDFTITGGPQVFADSALYALVACDSTALGLPEMTIEITNG